MSSYSVLNGVAASLVADCVVHEGLAGWRPTGQYNAMGVFIWSTGSQQDKEIGDDEARFDFPTSAMSGNGSASIL